MDSQNCSMEREKIDFLNKFLEKVFEKHPDLNEISPSADLLNNHKRVIERFIMHLRNKYHYNQQKSSRRLNTSGSWRVRNSEEIDNDDPERSREEASNRNPRSQEGMRRDGFGSRFENRGFRERMRFDRSDSSERRREGMESHGGNSRFESNRGEMDVANPRFDNRSRGGSRFHGDEDGMSNNQPNKTMDNRRQYGNNNNNRYDTTITDWRRRSNE